MFQRDIRWRQGSFLEPQHFQLLDLRRRVDNSFLANSLKPHAWGFRELKINEASLLSHFFEIVKMDLWLPDGRRLLFPENAEILAGSFREAFGPAEDRLTVYLSVPHFLLSGANARDPRPFSSLTEADPPAEGDRGQLYRAQEEPDLIPDLLGRGPAGRVETMMFQARLTFGDRKPDESSQLIPLARLWRDGEKVRLDPTYGPPALELYPGHPAKPALSDALALMLARHGQLEEYRLDPVQFRQADLDGPGQALLALLGIFGRRLPQLSILEQTPALHPFAVYAALAELAGELAVFSPPGGVGSRAESFFLPPKYDHLDPMASLDALKAAIERLLGAMSFGPALSLAFHREEDAFLLELPEEGLGEGPYCLSIRSPIPARELGALIGWRARLGPPERLEFLAAHSLPGIGLYPQKSAPPGLPNRPDLSYFYIRQNDPLWTEAKDSGKLGLLWPEAPESALVRLAASRR
ncbi:MAG: type VI secretion system baseplate subunit TssK [Deltaproteobacteria bacterium]|jgi:type VI secretion system protein ImpJ|nr:type VI secretion system baseplate subunit TssK [Deltaproteobacteria bacterium]